MTDSYVFDTYAIIEIIRGNKNYEKYLDADMVVTDFILAELCYNIIKYFDEDTAMRYTDEYALFLFEVPVEVVKKAMLLRYKLRNRKVSMTDCIGYVLALSLGIRFLTGDKEFETLPNVEFVK